jgi:uncharacterized protein
MKRTTLTRCRSLILIGVVYFAVILFGHLPDHLILFPSRHPIDSHGAARKTIPFENGELELWMARSPAAKKSGRVDVYILRFYGNADRAERWVTAEAGIWNDRQVEVWGVNYPGFGGSTGPARLDRVGAAAVSAFDALKREAVDRPIIAFGASLGTTAALDVAACRPVTGLILHNPPALRQMVVKQFGWWNLWLLAGPVALQIPKDLDSVANAQAIHKPAIFFLAEKDEVVASRFQHLVVDAYAGKKRVVTLPGANHNTPIEVSAVADLRSALDWLIQERRAH